jgi:hypothetical protein
MYDFLRPGVSIANADLGITNLVLRVRIRKSDTEPSRVSAKTISEDYQVANIEPELTPGDRGHFRLSVSFSSHALASCILREPQSTQLADHRPIRLGSFA